MYLLGAPDHRPRIVTTPRVGVDYAKEWKDALLRFLDADSAAVSKPPARDGSRRRRRS